MSYSPSIVRRDRGGAAGRPGAAANEPFSASPPLLGYTLALGHRRFQVKPIAFWAPIGPIAPEFPAAPKPAPLGDSAADAPQPRRDRGAWLVPNQARASRNAAVIDASLRALQASLDRVEAHQTIVVNGLAENYDAKA